MLRFLAKNRPSVKVRIRLLDGSDLRMDVPWKSKGQLLVTKVMAHLNILENEYFGLQVIDAPGLRWIDPDKQIGKQLRNGRSSRYLPYISLRLRVRFYASHPNQLREEITRYQFFLQLKQDLLDGLMLCSRATAAQLAALALQAEVGNYQPELHDADFVSEFHFVPDQDAAFEEEVLTAFKKLIGLKTATAELRFLLEAKKLESYGVEMHMVQGKDGSDYFLGLTPSGIVIYEGTAKIGLFLWPRILRLSFKKKKLKVVVIEGEEEHTFVFQSRDRLNCKEMWKSAVAYHAFFRLRSTCDLHPNPTFLRMGSNFRYRGKTEFQSLVQSRPRRSVQFERTPSKRHQRRTSSGLSSESTVSQPESSHDVNSLLHKSDLTKSTPPHQRVNIDRSRSNLTLATKMQSAELSRANSLSQPELTSTSHLKTVAIITDLNCLVGPENSVKICDYGMSRSIYKNDYYDSPSGCRLPIRWMAWESVLLGKFSTKSDVWAFGVTLWEILTFCREQPYESLSDERIIGNLSKLYKDKGRMLILSCPFQCPREVRDLMKECWQKDQAERPSFREIHLFLQRKNLGYDPLQDVPRASDRQLPEQP